MHQAILGTRDGYIKGSVQIHFNAKPCLENWKSLKVCSGNAKNCLTKICIWWCREELHHLRVFNSHFRGMGFTFGRREYFQSWNQVGNPDCYRERTALTSGIWNRKPRLHVAPDRCDEFQDIKRVSSYERDWIHMKTLATFISNVI